MDQNLLEKEASIFGSVFLLANKLQALIDQDFAKYGLTAKQWFLMAVLGKFFSESATISQLASVMGSSHQNVKQLALKLEKGGWVRMEKDKHDKRITRVSLTIQTEQFWEGRQHNDVKFFNELFANFTESEIDGLFTGLEKLHRAVSQLS
ncbi:MarR family transcriptional regulator [Bacillus sp. HMF5848]|uniref:MarR family winged helix-turn-helix transcriptional regulator n=1 Tax=Bacillus sp. HMF5848 TaxID=2495421 RepID=UPI000F76AFE5|nr:MarR family transcriptional regulator [Bacillus sp. HMF5848]RSK25968.1 MarR family transcriptional regulator [Bacillus sp. HMF5848]